MKMGGEKKSMYFGLTITLETGHLLSGGWEVLVHFHFPAYNRHLYRLYHGISSITSPPLPKSGLLLVPSKLFSLVERKMEYT